MNFIYNKRFKNSYFPISAVIMSILTGILTSVICGDGIFVHPNLFSVLLIMIILLLTSDILLTIAYAKREETLEEKQREINTQKDLIEKQEKAFFYLLETFNDLGSEFMRSSEKIYKVVKNAQETGRIRLDSWNKRNFYDFICDSLHEYICKVAEKGDDFSVSIITKDTRGRSNVFFMMSRSRKSKGTPKIYNKEIYEKDAKKYFYWNLFNSNNSDFVILNKKEINENFFFNNETDKKKYNQYIGIPIYCPGNNMIALLQIIAHKDCIIYSDKGKLGKLIENIGMVYSNFALLGDKIEKVFLM